MGGKGRRRKQLLSGLNRGRKYWKFKKKETRATLYITRFGRDQGPAVRQTIE